MLYNIGSSSSDPLSNHSIDGPPSRRPHSRPSSRPSFRPSSALARNDLALGGRRYSSSPWDEESLGSRSERDSTFDHWAAATLSPDVSLAGQPAASEAVPAGGCDAGLGGSVAKASGGIVEALEAALEALREEALGARDDKRLAVQAVHEARAERAQVVADLEDEIDELREQVEHLEAELEGRAREEASVRRTAAAAAEKAAAASEERVRAEAEVEMSARVVEAVEAERARARGANVEVALQTEASFLRRFDAAEGALPVHGPAQVRGPALQRTHNVPAACVLLKRRLPLGHTRSTRSEALLRRHVRRTRHPEADPASRLHSSRAGSGGLLLRSTGQVSRHACRARPRARVERARRRARASLPRVE